MMLHPRRGMGDATTDATILQGCLAKEASSPYFGGLLAITDPNCWAALYQYYMYGVIPPAPEAASKAVPLPPSQAMIDTMTPDQIATYEAATQNILATEAVQGSIQTAIDTGTYTPPGTGSSPTGGSPTVASGVCAQGSPQYNGMLCWLSQNSGVVLIVGASIAAIGLFAPPARKRRR